MKVSRFIIIAFIFSIFHNCQNSDNKHKSEIDTFSNDIEIQNFIRKNFKQYPYYKVQKIQDFKNKDSEFQLNIKLANDLGVDKSFYKADFDKNGLTDLLVIGDDFSCIGSSGSCSFKPIVIMNFDKNKYEIVNISPNFDEKFTPKIVSRNEQDLLEIYRPEILDWQKEIVSNTPKKQVLIYKLGDFIEYNSNENNYIPIKKIEISTHGCFGTCPVFDMEINQDKTAKFVAKSFNFSNDLDSYPQNEGTFETKIKDTDFNNLMKTLEYVDFPSLQDEYNVGWDDVQVIDLKITYRNGKVKTIEDVGGVGTYGLKKVYKTLFDFRKNQTWQKITD